MNLGDRAHLEIQQLHEFFVDWFNAALDDTDETFSRVERALHHDFTMVLPSGVTIDRGIALEQIRAAHGGTERPSSIEIVDVVTHVDGADTAVVSYEERQLGGGELQNRRTSTACFVAAPEAPNGVQWRRLHETALADN